MVTYTFLLFWIHDMYTFLTFQKKKSTFYQTFFLFIYKMYTFDQYFWLRITNTYSTKQSCFFLSTSFAHFV